MDPDTIFEIADMCRDSAPARPKISMRPKQTANAKPKARLTKSNLTGLSTQYEAEEEPPVVKKVTKKVAKKLVKKVIPEPIEEDDENDEDGDEGDDEVDECCCYTFLESTSSKSCRRMAHICGSPTPTDSATG